MLNIKKLKHKASEYREAALIASTFGIAFIFLIYYLIHTVIDRTFLPSVELPATVVETDFNYYSYGNGTGMPRWYAYVKVSGYNEELECSIGENIYSKLKVGQEASIHLSKGRLSGKPFCEGFISPFHTPYKPVRSRRRG